MKVFYVIKDAVSDKYWSTQNLWDELYMSMDFNKEEDAFLYAYDNVHTYYTIEKIYNNNN